MLCCALRIADIPLSKMENTKFNNFLQKYTSMDHRKIPSSSVLRQKYMPAIYEDALNVLREKAAGKKLWVSLDETIDADQRNIFNFAFGIMGEEGEDKKCYLLNVAEFPSCNASTTAAFFNDSLSLLYPEGIEYGNILLVTTDAAPYMKAAMQGLAVLYPKMLHVTCLAHGLHRVCEVIRATFPNVNSLISSVKKVFRKAPHRKQAYHEASGGNIPLPPSPIITRWGTWLEAAIFYANNFELIDSVVFSLDPEEAQSIIDAQNALQTRRLKEDLIFLKNNFMFLTTLTNCRHEVCLLMTASQLFRILLTNSAK